MKLEIISALAKKEKDLLYLYGLVAGAPDVKRFELIDEPLKRRVL